MPKKKTPDCVEETRPTDGKIRKTIKSHYSEKGSHKKRGEFWKYFKDRCLNER